MLILFIFSLTFVNIDAKYTLVDDYNSKTFTYMFDFYTGDDPASGHVQFLSKEDAIDKELFKTFPNNSVYIGVDSTNRASEDGRESIRLHSKKRYNQGLFILDFVHIPKSVCGSWVSFWLFGWDHSWPQSGEMHILNGVHDTGYNEMSLYSAHDCHISNSSDTFTGRLESSNCRIGAPGQKHTGCKVSTSKTEDDGALYAVEWTTKAVKVWAFSHDQLPPDIRGNQPDPSSWKMPLVNFHGDCDFAEEFRDQIIVLGITFCGFWSGSVWQQQCSSKSFDCNAFVRDHPNHFKESYWLINSLKVYSDIASPEPTTAEPKQLTTTAEPKRLTTTAETKQLTTTLEPARDAAPKYDCTSSKMSDSARTQILNTHNYLRSRIAKHLWIKKNGRSYLFPQGKNMYIIGIDCTLESWAQASVDKCSTTNSPEALTNNASTIGGIFSIPKGQTAELALRSAFYKWSFEFYKNINSTEKLTKNNGLEGAQMLYKHNLLVGCAVNQNCVVDGEKRQVIACVYQKQVTSASEVYERGRGCKEDDDCALYSATCEQDNGLCNLNSMPNLYSKQSTTLTKSAQNSSTGFYFAIFVPLAIIYMVLLCILRFWYKKLNKKRMEAIYALAGKKLPKMNKILQKLPDNDPWEIEPENLIINKNNRLGAGASGEVYAANLIGSSGIKKVCKNSLAVANFHDCEVAVKVLPPFASEAAKAEFQEEIAFMKTLKYHLHVVTFLGYVNSNSSMLVLEYCSNNNLLKFVRSNKDNIINAQNNLNLKNLVLFAWEIGKGLDYLGSLGYIHRDVAARNVLLDKDYVCKISDFGLCRGGSDLYTSKGGKLPVRWMSIESLKAFEYTTKADVWSYGVLLFELFSFGEVPYTGLGNGDVLPYLESGKRLQKPVYCTEEIYELMLNCWQVDLKYRPNFTEICMQLAKILEASNDYYGYLDVTPSLTGSSTDGNGT